MEESFQWYQADRENEIAKGVVHGDRHNARVVVRQYELPPEVAVTLESPVQFVALEHTIDDEFDVAIYVPDYLSEIVGTDMLLQSLKPLIFLAGSVLLDAGPEAVNRLG